MKFELSSEIISRIVFGMENQEIIHVFDTESLELVPADISLAEERYLPLPEWKSVDGFNLMEAFVGNLRNPVFREELRDILKNGRGVFRLFKNALKDRPDIERLWFRHRQKEMNQRVLDWYNDYRELWGLEPYSSLEQDAGKEDLVFSDFEFRLADVSESPFLAAWDRQLFEEAQPDCLDDDQEYLYGFSRRGLPAPASNKNSRVVVATTPDGELAGFVWSVEQMVGKRHFGRIVQLGVLPEFRGIGIAATLIRWYRQDAIARGLQRLLVDLPASVDFLAGHLKSQGFVVASSSWMSRIGD